MRDLKYIFKKIIIFTSVAILVYLFKLTFTHAQVIECGGTIKLNNQTLSNTSTTTVSANNNLTLSFTNLWVRDSQPTVEQNHYYTDIELLDNSGWSDWTTTSGGYLINAYDLGYKATGLFSGQKDGVVRFRIIWTANAYGMVAENVVQFSRNDTGYHYAGSIPYTAGMRIRSITCGYGSDMPVDTDYDREQLKALQSINSNLNNVTNAVNNSTTQITGAIGTAINAYAQNTQRLLDAMKEEFSDNDANEMKSWLGDFDSDTYGLTDIITIPLSTIESIATTTCSQPLHLPIPFLNNKYLDLPCMTPIYQSTFGSVFTIYQTVTTALIGYWVIVRIFALVKGMKDPDDDKIEVVDL